MANANIQAVNWCNTKVRPMADLLYSCYLSAKSFKSLADAQAIYGASNPIPNDATVIADGAATDGRPLATDAQATNIYTRCAEFIQWMENGLVASPFGATVTDFTLNTVAGVQVNGKAVI